MSRHSVAGQRAITAGIAFSDQESSASYARASIELYSRLWLELERMSEVVADEDHFERWGGIERQLAILRLELIVLLDACDSLRWQTVLTREQHLNMRSTLDDLLGTLGVPPEALGRGHLARAQNQLLDAVLVQYAEVSEGQTAVLWWCCAL